MVQQVPMSAFDHTSGFLHLGVPISQPQSTTFASKSISARLAKVQKLYGALEGFPSAHIQYTLLRSCLDACRVGDLLRSIPLGTGDASVQQCSLALRQALAHCIGSPTDDHQWAQATLPIRHGGLGLRDPVLIRTPARLSAIIGFVTGAQGSVPLLSDTTMIPPTLQQHFLQRRLS